MATCSVRWRSSGGRGEFEYVPADSLENRKLELFFEPLDLTIPAEVEAVKAQGKPRLRKLEKNNRKKFHLPQLVMAVARLPEPAREMTVETVSFPLENKSFVMDAMDFDIVADDGTIATLAPLRVSIRNSNFQIDLQDRFTAIAIDLKQIPAIASEYPELAAAIEAHGIEIKNAINSINIRHTADRINEIQMEIFGPTNAGSAVAVQDAFSKPATDLEEDIVGLEGRLLTRIHAYKERDRKFVARAKKYFMDRNGGKLTCEACGLDPEELYGPDGGRCIEAHHKIPIEELQPDSITRVHDLAMVCASCHRIIHGKRPCLTIPEVTVI